MARRSSNHHARRFPQRASDGGRQSSRRTIFNRIGEFHHGVAVATDSRQFDEKHNVKFITSLVPERGEILATDTYTEIGDFERGVAWASHRWTDRRGPYQHEGWGLIDTSAHELTDLAYVGAHWVWSNSDSYSDNMCPKFYGDLAPVAAVNNYHRYGGRVWELNAGDTWIVRRRLWHGSKRKPTSRGTFVLQLNDLVETFSS